MKKVFDKISDIDMLGLLRPVTYDEAVSHIITLITPDFPDTNPEEVAVYVHRLYLALALRDNEVKIPLVKEYLQSRKTEVYKKLEALNPDAYAYHLRGILLSEYPELVPDVNRILLMSGINQVPPIRNDLGGMQHFVDSVRYSLATKNWFGALFMALALPDICAAVEHGKATGARYADWFNRYLKSKYDPQTPYEFYEARNPGITANWPAESISNAQQPDPRIIAWRFIAEDCYQFRCKTLHQGLPQRAKDDTSKIHFSPPTGTTFHQTLIVGQWWLSIDLFCEDVCLAVEKWLADVQGNAAIQSRLASLMTI